MKMGAMGVHIQRRSADASPEVLILQYYRQKVPAFYSSLRNAKVTLFGNVSIGMADQAGDSLPHLGARGSSTEVGRMRPACQH